MKTLNFLVLGIVVSLFTACSPTLSPFTDNIYNDLGYSDDELSRIQFYLSHDIVLYRNFGGSESKVENGKIKLVDGRKVEEVIFKEGTPGVFVFSPKNARMAISFEDNDENYLMFGANDKAGGKFVLLAKEWKKRNGKVTYAGKLWNTTSQSAYSNLLVDLDKARKTQYNRKTVSGRKVN